MISAYQIAKVDTVSEFSVESSEIKNLTSTGYDIYVYGVRSINGVSKVVFPTWTDYGGQDDIIQDWKINNKTIGTNLGNGTWKYHVDISTHNNEGGKYITHVYIIDNNGNNGIIIAKEQIISTSNYIGSLYLTEANSNFSSNSTSYRVGTQTLYNNFTYEFDAKPSVTTPIYSLGDFADVTSKVHNFIICESYNSTETQAGIGLAIGTNGAVAIAHADGYYYVLLTYTGDLSKQHRYRFTVDNNIPKLYIDGNLAATGSLPVSPITTLSTYGYVLSGTYGNYSGYANNFVLYNNAR